MAHLLIEGLNLEFPIYHASARSMRRFAIGGALGRRLDLDHGRATIRALRDVDLELNDGDRLALIGPNGAGKTSLLRTVAGVYAPLSGSIFREGKVTPLLSIGMGMQPEATGRENILLLGMHLDIPPGEMRPRIDEIVEWTELGAFIGAPLKTYSAGMILRLAFAVSTSFRPEILLLDEWLGVADAEFQAKAYERMASFVGGSSILVLASHAAHLLESWCNMAVRMDGGRIVERGEVKDLVPKPAA
jgi:ABC-type polysaccharide/polyol phosphate transport system ATPase subunit